MYPNLEPMNRLNLPEKSSIVIIAGMHRSGTSLTASLLESAGLHIGRDLVGTNKSNPKGHFENKDFLDFHKAVLRSEEIIDKGWTLQENITIEEQYVAQAKEIVAKNAISSLWGWKEPRTTLFLEFWANLLPEANFLLIYRSPWEVVDSLYRRREDTIFQREPELAIKLWIHYNKKIINFYNHFSRRCFLANLREIVKDPNLYVEAIKEKFKIPLSEPASNLYDPSLLHHQQEEGYRPSLIDYYFPEAIEIYQELEARTWQPDESLDLSWKELIKASPYRVWVFKDWVNLQGFETENKALRNEIKQLKSQLEQTHKELEKVTSKKLKTQEELEQSQDQLHQTESQLRQTEEVLEKSQSQLRQTEQALEQSHSQLKYTQEELTRTQSQVHQTQEKLEQSQGDLSQTRQELQKSLSSQHRSQLELEQKYAQVHQLQEESEQFYLVLQEKDSRLKQSQSQLSQTQLELTTTQSQLSQTQLELKQSKVKLEQTEKEFGLTQSQLSQTQEELVATKSQFQITKSQFQTTQEELEQKSVQVHQLQEESEQYDLVLQEKDVKLKQSQSQLKKTEELLDKSQSQLHQTEEVLKQSHSQFKQTKAELEGKQSELQETQEHLKQSNVKLNQTEKELVQVQSKWSQSQQELEQTQSQLKQVQAEFERSRLQQAIAGQPDESYQLLLQDAWYAYKNGNLEKMARYLQQSLKYKPFSRTETVLNWLESFAKFSMESGVSLNTESLTNSDEWKQLVRRLMSVKSKLVSA
jgi:uncharacterized protein (DUF3084 family)